MQLIKRLQCNKIGNIGLLTALALPVLLVLGGGAVDLSLVYTSQLKLRAAADAAALGAAQDARIAYVNKETNVDLQNLMTQAGLGQFRAQVASEKLFTIDSVNVTSTVDNNAFDVRVNYKAHYNSYFLNIVGLNKFNISSQSRATVTAPAYIQIALVFDISQSMGIGATPTDQDKIMTMTGGCALACHISDLPRIETYSKVHAAGVQTRMDVAVQAANNAVDDVNKTPNMIPGQVKYSVHTFSNIFADQLAASDSRGTNTTYVKSVIGNIQLSTEYGGTGIENALYQINKKLGKSGSGLSANDRINYVFVLTDAVENQNAWTASRGWHTETYPNMGPNNPYLDAYDNSVIYAVNPNACDGLKSNGTKVFFLNVAYLFPQYNPDPLDTQRFEFIRSQLSPILNKRLQACAGDPENVVMANSPDDIKAKFSQILKRLASPLRLY